MSRDRPRELTKSHTHSPTPTVPTVAALVDDHVRRCATPNRETWHDNRALLHHGDLLPLFVKKPLTVFIRTDIVCMLDEAETAAVRYAAVAEGYPFGDAGRLRHLTDHRRQQVASLRWPDVDLDAALWSMLVAFTQERALGRSAART